MSLSVFSQTFEWARQMGGTWNDQGRSVAIDVSGNVYTLGYFNDTVDFDPGPGTSILISNGGSDVFVQKLDASGNFIWVKQLGGSYSDYGNSIAIDNSGNIITIGNFYGLVDFDPGPGTFYLSSAGGDDIFIQKMDSNGNNIWAKRIGGLNRDFGSSVTSDSFGNIYCTGGFQDLVDFDPDIGILNLNAVGLYDVFIQKLDSSGSLIWVKQIGGSNSDYGITIKLDSSLNIYASGSFQGIVDFDPGLGTNYLDSDSLDQIFILKIDFFGNFIWARQLAGIYFNCGGCSTVDLSGNVYSTGYFQDTVDFDLGTGDELLFSAGNTDVFIQKLDSSGNFIWAKRIGGIYGDVGHSITTDEYGNVYTTGYYSSTVDFDPGPGTYYLTASGLDIFIQKLDTFGNLIWAKGMGGMSSISLGISVSVDHLENVYTTGSFSDTVDFDPGLGTSVLTTNGFSDVYIHKLSQSTIGMIEHNLTGEYIIYPNPTNGNYFIDLGDIYEHTTITTYDISGRIIQSAIFNHQQVLILKIENEPGIYFIAIYTGKSNAMRRIIKQ